MQDDFAGVCSPNGKEYPLIHQAGLSINNKNLTAFPEIDPSKGLCIPFLGLTDCKGAFNFGTPKLNSSIESTTATTGTITTTIPATTTTTPIPSTRITNKLIDQLSTTPLVKTSSVMPSIGAHSSLVSIAMLPINTKLPAVPTGDSSTSTLSFNYSSPESILTTLRSSVDETTVAPITPGARMAADEHLVRTRRSSISLDEYDGTQPSYSYLRPPGIDSAESTLNFLPCKIFLLHF